MKKRHWVVIIAVTVIVAGVGGGLYWQRTKHRETQTATASVVRTAVVQRRTVSSSIEAVGDLQALRQESLYAKIAGKVSEILVKPGDSVRPGQVLARLRSDDAELAVADAKDNLQLAKNRLASAQDTYRKAPQSAEVALQKAKQEHLNANLKVEELSAGPKPAEIEQLRSSLRQTQLNLQSAQSELANQEVLYKAKAISRSEYEQSVNAVTVAQDNVRNAQLKLDDLLAGSDQQEKDAAAAALKQAEINLKMAENDFAKVASKDAVIEAEAAVRNAEKALRTAEENLASLTIKAPFSGMVLSTNAVVGQEKAAGNANDAIVSMSAPDRWQVVAYVDESDLANLSNGQRATVTLTAMEDREFNGRVTAIGGTARNSQNVVSYPIYIELDTFHSLFRPGMSADVQVQLVYRPNVIAVPDAAIEERRGKYMVKVPGEGENGEPGYIQVDVGEKAGGYTEIITGLEEGKTVILPGKATTSQQSQAGSRNGNSNQRVMMAIPRF